jgi:hypothetical protein
MNTDIQGHNHGGKNHLLGMLGIGALVLVVLLATGNSFRTALPFAALLACPLMMGGMMFMMMRGGNGRQQGNDAPNQRDNNGVIDHRNHDAPETWRDSPNITPPSVPTDDHPTLIGHADQPVVGTFGVVNGEKRRNRRLLLTTNTELNAMAAPAIRGLSRPSAAKGMAATL